MVAERLLDFHVVEKGPVVILLEVALAVLETAGEGVAPTAVEPAGGVAQRRAVKPKLPTSCLTDVFREDSMPEVTMLTVPPMAGKASLEARGPLNLHGLGHQIQPKPIVPIHAPLSMSLTGMPSTNTDTFRCLKPRMEIEGPLSSDPAWVA